MPKTIPFNINRSLNKKDKSKISSRKYNRLHGICRDGSSSSREMAQATRFNMYRRIREEKKDPYTKHPLSFEEFDNIPGIEDLIEKKEFLGEKDENKSK